MDRDIERVLFREDELANAVRALGERITSDYRGKDPLFVGILKGSFVFMADLIRAVDLNPEIDFITASSYGDKAVSSGEVDIRGSLTARVAGRDVLLIEDIYDTGRTLDRLCKALAKEKPASVGICTLLDKKVPKVSDRGADYKCFDIDNEFVVGYGLDYAQRYRALPYIGVLKKEIYQ
ncbi:MAG: hypoxanthine phosphoribosyltransferase [Bacteroides sp.]|nr:hypoxanthine phosphoribosyltransferase [Eubacterium sp.]MCM1418266.1 hypoxanthine phosphoribosyltransferase [Roseburia sp.]MCM1462351.1 hypoxanthine phosphoribosyltransferase [Bacteroides sp.]